jgi:cytochrome c553
MQPVRIMRKLLLLVLACSADDAVYHGDTHDPRRPEPPRPVTLDRKAMVDAHMRRHFDDLRDVERALIAGDLETAKTRAFLLTKPAQDRGLAPWASQMERVTEAAKALADAPSIDEGLRRETRVATACAACHLAAQHVPKFSPRIEPPDADTEVARMARHAWAADRLWEGMVIPADAQWRAGLHVLASTPLPHSPATDAQPLANSLQRQAKLELEVEEPITLEHRAAAYGEILVTCAACHATLHAR